MHFSLYALAFAGAASAFSLDTAYDQIRLEDEFAEFNVTDKGSVSVPKPFNVSEIIDEHPMPAPRVASRDFHKTLVRRGFITASGTGSWTDLNRALFVHNYARQRCGYSFLHFDGNLQNNAFYQAYLNAVYNTLSHQLGPQGDGQNLYEATSSGPIDDGFEAASRAWFNERYSYTPGEGFTEQTGHYTQMVWPNTNAVGFGFAIARNGALYVSAHYQTPGNVIGQVAVNPGGSW